MGIIRAVTAIVPGADLLSYGFRALDETGRDRVEMNIRDDLHEVAVVGDLLGLEPPPPERPERSISLVPRPSHFLLI